MYFSMGTMMWGWPAPGFLAENHVAMGLLQLLLSAVIMVINQKKVPVKETVSGNPKTGDKGHIAFAFALMFLSGICLTGITAYGKKKKRSK